MERIIKIIIASFTCCVLVCVPIFIFPITQANVKNIDNKEYKTIIKLWHIDTFEGGIGSRQDFLSSVVRDFERANKGTIISVINHTKKSAEENLKKQITPDMISFGSGIDFVLDYAKELKGVDSSVECKISNKKYAVCYFYGGYFLIAKEKIDKKIDRLLISKSDYTSPYISLLLSDYKALTTEENIPLTSYTKFLQEMKKGTVLLGTQRDIFRLKNRQLEFCSVALESFNDIRQYISIFSEDKEKYDYCLKFINILLSKKWQEKLNGIGMNSPFEYNLYGEDEHLTLRYSQRNQYLLSPFIKYEEMQKLDCLAKNELLKEDKNLIYIKNQLKQLKNC